MFEWGAGVKMSNGGWEMGVVGEWRCEILDLKGRWTDWWIGSEKNRLLWMIGMIESLLINNS